MPRPIIATFAMTLSLAACAQTPAPVAAAPAPVADPTSPAHCDASKATQAIGQLPDADIQEQARIAAGAEVVRVLGHNQPITKEYRVGRLNLVLDAEGRIASANCS
ncbi:MAG TPA: I78 family peptidase inhibitor [Pseudoxanthomonas sp.]|nr:I78 family peptidase inhibitor [Pseudoxanthomonas sp.]